MSDVRFSNLFSPVHIGSVKVPNRIVSTGHHTYLAHQHPSEELIAYHEARAKGGVGLIVSEIIAVHRTAMFSNQLLMALNRNCIGHYRKLADRVHAHGTMLFGQLFHPGRETRGSEIGMIPPVFAPSAVPNERFHIMPQPMSTGLIGEIVDGYAFAAACLAQAGFDGVEIVASHGYLPSQFLNPAVNLRDDAYGGDFERRLTFIREVIRAVRAGAPEIAVGIRISADEIDDQGLSAELVTRICSALTQELDYFSIVTGTSASLVGSVHVVPPMGVDSAYITRYSETIRKEVDKPVIATGRINQPQSAESIIASGQADLCGMTRALITDPELPNKARRGQLDDIRACIACNQSCIGRAHKGLGISCIQNPVSGRETKYANTASPDRSKKVIVVGGGPGGMKAAVTAAQKGHRVSLHESASRLGGQALLAQKLPGREEFGGLVTNLEHELIRSGVTVHLGSNVAVQSLGAREPDAVILATGALPYVPEFDGWNNDNVVTAWQVLDGTATIGAAVVIADWRADWVGVGIAELLTLSGCAVTLCTNAAMAGESLQLYTRNHYVARLHKLEVAIKTHARLVGVDPYSAYFQDTLTLDPIVIEPADTVVLALGHRAVNISGNAPDEQSYSITSIGDCVSPRTAEEAIYEGFIAGNEV